ncbi:hypothetical protein M419DRAFT_70199 [Trichoderma reesei RUT C-30]|uniref:F-box domain-containing protein n=1 Tax=Hypocrea jecorina (strain ATCC 56765 / BCRC 32924 / NRRL 11460 / Rut C-30) TaxID=1344414 RepID=A0A024SMK8_HYPJR|nr:hypothetical protein M419DRAFT_70199 [Trichoderma reesei RUT C-30]
MHCFRLLGKGCRLYMLKKPKAAILQLPPEILLLIIDNLALHDKFLLSHTCKALRHLVSQDWDTEFSRLSLEDQIGFWVGLAYTLPNRWACVKCCKLHPVDTSDVPAAFWRVRYRDVPCSVEYSRGIEVEGYSMQHYHIQFALKLSRLGNVHQQYLAALMAPYTRTGISLIPPLAESRSCKEWSLHRLAHMPTNHDVQQQLAIWLRDYTLLEDGIALAYASPGQWIFDSCLHCPTDIAIKISVDEREATVRAWHDFGTEGSPLDISWKAHVRNINAPPWLDPGPYVHYTHGSIREMWSEDISHCAGSSQAKVPSFYTKLIHGLCRL